MRLSILFSAVLLFSCSQTSHLPAPWELPGVVIGTAVDNAVYGNRRKLVKQFIQTNYVQLKNDVVLGHGKSLSKLFDTAKVRSKRQDLLKELQDSNMGYFLNDQLSEEGLEKLTVAVMVHSE